jgi:hypothetical protein
MPVPVGPARLEAEWQARMLGIVSTLIDAGTLTWAEFRTAVLSFRAGDARAITDEASVSDDEAWADLEDWAPALRKLLRERGLLSPDDPIAEQ